MSPSEFCTDLILFWQVLNDFTQRETLDYEKDIIQLSDFTQLINKPSVCHICLSQYADGCR